MAASEGFLTSIYAGEDITRPTFFELVAVDQLMDALRPALRFLVAAFAEQAPPWLLPVLARWDQIQAAGVIGLEYYHLRTHAASFAEHFFGLVRERAAARAAPTPLEQVEVARRRRTSPGLPRRLQVASLLLVAILPALRTACEAAFHEAQGLVPAARTAWQNRLVRWYPWLHAACQSAALSHRILYLLGQTRVWSPALRLLGLELVRHFPAPEAEGQQDLSPLQMAWQALSSAGTRSLWGLVYLMQFGQWWYAREHLLQPYQPRKTPPPPPPRPPYAATVSDLTPLGSARTVPRLVLLPQDPGVCPLCHLPRTNPAMSASGYVFCYPCLVKYAQEHGRCPVTGFPTAPEQVRRIRDEASQMVG